jgi:glutaredoxin
MPPSLALRTLTLGAFAALAACHGAPVLSPAQIDAAAVQCKAMIGDGRFDAHGFPSRIGFEAARKPAGTPVIVYGAPWCTACHAAAEYMERRGIPFEERDVDEDADARRDRASTLAAAGLPESHALPIIDVRGTVVVGFMACAVEEAWGAP